MPKVKKIRAAAFRAQTTRHAPLGQAIVEDEERTKFALVRNRQKSGGRVGTTSNKKMDQKNDNTNDDEDNTDEARELFDEKTSRKILQLSREQQKEIELEEARKERMRNKAAVHSKDVEEEEDDMEVHDSDEECEDDMVTHDNGYVTLQDGALSPEDEAIVASMMGGGERKQTLADIILAKIAEKEAEVRGESMDDHEMAPELPPKVVEVYTDIGKILSRYTSGKLPKAFKVIPSLSNWEDVLYLTRPDQWSPMAMFAATRIFASNLNPKMAQRFYNLVLLDAVRADIVTNKKLNYHYFMALKKSVYKPAAFFKGILLPLCKDNCTLREAAIIASVLARVSIPVHHAAVALHKLAQLEYTGASSIFIKTLLDKKYSLPAPVLASLVQHFVSFLHDDRTLPVLWHQALLVFLQRYKNEIQRKEDLRRLMKKHFHPKITPECRRELFGAQAYREERMDLN